MCVCVCVCVNVCVCVGACVHDFMCVIVLGHVTVCWGGGLGGVRGGDIQCTKKNICSLTCI